MENIDNLIHLEKAVAKLMHAVGDIEKEKLVLEARVESRDQELASLKKEVAVFQEEREQIQKRVSRLLGSIEKWEKFNETQEESESHNTKVEEKTLF